MKRRKEEKMEEKTRVLKGEETGRAEVGHIFVFLELVFIV